MNKTQQLEAALEWALKVGAYAPNNYSDGRDVYIMSAGCGCCAFSIYPNPDAPQDEIPDEIKAVVLKAAKKVAS